jgi:ATP-dependent Lon protease
VLTGQLGDVMKESARAALTYVLAHADELGIPNDVLSDKDVHIHVPAGGVPKDGPSAGVTMFTTLASLLSGRPVRDDVAMTGELTLTGQVLPIGGLKEKVLAAQRAGISKVLFPSENEPDLEELPEETRKALEFIPVDWIQEVLEVAFDGSLPKAAPAQAISRVRKAAAAR